MFCGSSWTPLNRLAAVDDQGVPDDEAEAGRKALRSVWARVKGAYLKPGQKYSETRLQKATEYLRTHLVHSGRLAPTRMLPREVSSRH